VELVGLVAEERVEIAVVETQQLEPQTQVAAAVVVVLVVLLLAVQGL
jgi:hypothetical protein